jgi:hypothetical protein
VQVTTTTLQVTTTTVKLQPQHNLQHNTSYNNHNTSYSNHSTSYKNPVQVTITTAQVTTTTVQVTITTAQVTTTVQVTIFEVAQSTFPLVIPTQLLAACIMWFYTWIKPYDCTIYLCVLYRYKSMRLLLPSRTYNYTTYTIYYYILPSSYNPESACLLYCMNGIFNPLSRITHEDVGQWAL